MAYDFKNLETELQKITEWFKSEAASFRTGRATPALLENVQVNYHGAKTPLKQLATINIQDAKTLLVQPWDKTAVVDIESAIRSEVAGMQPLVDKEIIRVKMPELTGERREELLKGLNKKLEEARIRIRQERDGIWKDIQDKEQTGEITEDEKFRYKDKLQEIIDQANKELEEIANIKKKEIQR